MCALERTENLRDEEQAVLGGQGCHLGPHGFTAQLQPGSVMMSRGHGRAGPGGLGTRELIQLLNSQLIRRAGQEGELSPPPPSLCMQESWPRPNLSGGQD